MRTAPALVLVGLLAAAATPGNARAEDETNREEASTVPPKPHVELPKLLTEAVVPYPEGGRGDSIVILALTLDPSGKVLEAEAETGEEPFRSAAINAARTFQFSPATRGHVAVSSKIRFEVLFREPEAASEEVNAPSVKTVEVPTPSSPEPPTQALEVDVLGARTEPTVRRFSRAEVRELPGAFGDPFRAIEALPGVTPIFSGVPFFYVRGAPPGNVGYFLDGIQVPLLYHAGLGPSVIHPGLVESVDLYPGAYPSRYGRFGGGIVAGETKAPEPEWRGEGNIRLFDTGALVEGPFANGYGNVLVAGRYSYTAALLSLLAPNTRLEYWDYQGRVSYDLSKRRRLTVFTFGSFDYFGQDGTSDDSFFSTEFHRVDLRYDEKPSKASELRTAVTLGVDRTRGGDGDDYVIDQKFGIRSEYKNQLSKSALLRAGVDSTLDHYRVEVAQSSMDSDGAAPSEGPSRPAPNLSEPGTAPDPVQSPLNPNPPTSNPTDAVPTTDSNEDTRVNFPSRSDVAMGVHADVVWKVAPRVTLTPGARLDYYSSDGASAVALEPRVTAQYQISRALSLTNALGLAHQPPSFVIPLPGFQLGGLRGGLQRSVQSSFGGELELGDDQQLSVTTFHNVFFNMTDILSLVRAGDRLDLGFDTKTTGQAYGVEVLFKRDLSRHLGGFVSYTLSRSIRYTDIGRLPASFDRTHVFNGALAYDIGRNWRGGGKLTFYTGSPGTGEFTFEKPQRLPPYYRLDVRLEKRWQLDRPKSSISFVLEVLNTTLNREAIDQSCDPLNGCRTEYVGPVTIPSIGVEGTF
ncbi:MAG: TonB-dependent receptor [Polyangiaceae bacterium]|nr:TonB-dependent receptor [Polyangiaceae bacterium]